MYEIKKNVFASCFDYLYNTMYVRTYRTIHKIIKYLQEIETSKKVSTMTHQLLKTIIGFLHVY